MIWSNTILLGLILISHTEILLLISNNKIQMWILLLNFQLYIDILHTYN